MKALQSSPKNVLDHRVLPIGVSLARQVVGRAELDRVHGRIRDAGAGETSDFGRADDAAVFPQIEAHRYAAARFRRRVPATGDLVAQQRREIGGAGEGRKRRRHRHGEEGCEDHRV